MPIVTINLNNNIKLFIQRLFVATAISICLNSCSKKDNNIPQTPPITLSPGATYYNNEAKVWKNGVPASLTDGSNEAKANSVYVSGNDVYVTGFENNINTRIAKVWKNGIATSLTNGSATAEGLSVYVSGNDVYVAGYDNYLNSTNGKRAVLWKNGVATYLTDGSSDAAANSVYVNGNDVYVAGYFTKVSNSSGIQVAALWKNGVAAAISTNPSTTSSVYISNNDIYVAGEEHPESTDYLHARLWKNGVSVTLQDAVKPTTAASSVFVSGNDVYVCGYEKRNINSFDVTLAASWKNTSKTLLTDTTISASIKSATTKSVYKFNNDVYTAGYQLFGATKTVDNKGNTTITTGKNIATLWKNGIDVLLTDGTKPGSANSVFVAGGNVYIAGYEISSKGIPF